MNYAAFFQENGGLRHTIGVFKMKHRAELACEQFVARMSNPEVGPWWVYIGETDEPLTEKREDITDTL